MIAEYRRSATRKEGAHPVRALRKSGFAFAGNDCHFGQKAGFVGRGHEPENPMFLVTAVRAFVMNIASVMVRESMTFLEHLLQVRPSGTGIPCAPSTDLRFIGICVAESAASMTGDFRK